MILQNNMGSCAMGAVMLMSTPDRSRLSTYDHNQETQDKIELRIDASLMSVMCVVGETLLMPVSYPAETLLVVEVLYMPLQCIHGVSADSRHCNRGVSYLH
jgi:hypothetical protein